MPFSEHAEHLGAVGYFNKLPARTVTQDGSTWTIDNTKGLFAFTQLVPDMPVEASVDGDGQAIERCDAGRNQHGPIAFHTWDETAQECSCGADTAADPLTGNHYILFHEITFVGSVFGSAAIGGQVIYLESSDADAEVLTVANRHSASARTIQELLRLMMEWEIAGTDFGSTEAMVGVATEMLEGLNMPADVRDWIWTNVPPNKVQKYLEGREDAQVADPPPDITGTIVEDWLVPLITESPQIGFMPTGSGS